MARILIVEDAQELLSLVAGFFESKGSFDVDTAADGNTALNLIGSNDYDIAILDIMLPGAALEKQMPHRFPDSVGKREQHP